MPLPLRPALDERARVRGATPHVLSEAERGALNVIAEHVRERARLQQVWIFAEASAGIEAVASASAGPQEIPDAAARVIALAALRRDERRRVRYESGVHFVTTETAGGRRITVVAAGGRSQLPSRAQTALAELADISARVLADEPPAVLPRAVDAVPAPTPTAPRTAAYGAGLAEALTLLKRPPILAQSRERVLHDLGQRYPAMGAAVRTVETDIGLALAIASAANQLPSAPRDGYASVPEALKALGPRAAIRIAEELPTLGPGGSGERLGTALARLSAHALATRAAADTLARQLGDPRSEELRLAALLHDVGKVVLAAASPEYLAALANLGATPEQRIADERRRLGIDHAAIGAVAVRRLGLPKAIGTAIERHHADDASGPAAIVRLADMIAHQAYGGAVAQSALSAGARSLRIDPAEVQRIAYELPRSREPREAASEPSPLTPMQHKALMGLASGLTYKQIAAELSVSESTVRTHLHNLYGKLEVSDRAQAVLLAAERGWI